jgi:hypothetical protein
MGLIVDAVTKVADRRDEVRQWWRAQAQEPVLA